MALLLAAGFGLAITALPLVSLGTATGPYDSALAAAADVVRANTSPNEPIFVGEAHNAHTLVNPLIAIYRLADRPPGFGHHVQPRGHRHRGDADLDGGRPEGQPGWGPILDVDVADCFEPSNESRIAGPSILDQEINRDYVVVADFGAVVIMGLRGAAPPVGDPESPG